VVLPASPGLAWPALAGPASPCLATTSVALVCCGLLAVAQSGRVGRGCGAPAGTGFWVSIVASGAAVATCDISCDPVEHEVSGGLRWARAREDTRGRCYRFEGGAPKVRGTKARLSARRHAHARAKATAQRTSFRLILQQCLVETGAGRGARAAPVWAQAAAAAKTAGVRTSRLGHTRSEWMRGMVVTLRRNISQPGQGVSRDMAKHLGLRRCSPRPVREPKLQRPQR
jgi:hypothetical protein